MNGRLSKDAVVDDLASRLAARRVIATGRRAGYERLALAVSRQRRQSDRTSPVIVSAQMAA
jgi:histidyl-tRNA synthetase